ncbi:MAG: sodium:calcium antiporter [Fulvivirga sp.]|nr:sodium:calcium antiporter [Fulvivirga sp.]
MGELLLYIVIILISSGIVWKGGGMLESSAEALSAYYKLSPTVQGSIVAAVGSSFPELSTTVISTLIHDEFDLGVSAIVGSAIFNILVIPGLSVLMAKKVKSEWNFVLKDMQFYVSSVLLMLLIFALTVIYEPVAGEVLKGYFTRGFAMIAIAFYVLYLYLQKQETDAYQAKKNPEKPEIKSIGRVWGRFIVSLVLIVISVEGLVRGAIFFGEYFNTPNFVWGVLVIATATSVPDAVVSIKEAIHKKGLTSLANVIGSNVFDLLVAIPAGILIAGKATVDFSVAAPLMVFLSISTILLILLLLRKNSLSRREGWVLLLFYLLFIICITFESIGVISVI